MWSLACWMAVALVNSRTAPLVAVYAAVSPGLPTSPAVDEMLTMEPPPACRMAGIAHFVPRKTPLTLTAMMRSQSASLVSSIFARNRMPALLTSTSSLPYVCTAVATAAGQSSSWVTFRCTEVAWPPEARIAVSTFLPSSSRMSPNTTAAPSRTNSWVSAAPCPRAPPLISATLPASLPMGVSSRSAMPDPSRRASRGQGVVPTRPPAPVYPPAREGIGHDSRALQGTPEGSGPGLGSRAAPHGDPDLREARRERGRCRGRGGRADDDRPARRRDARRVEHAPRVRARLQGRQARPATRLADRPRGARDGGDRRRAAAPQQRPAEGDAPGHRQGAHRRGRRGHRVQQRPLRRDRPLRDAGCAAEHGRRLLHRRGPERRADVRGEADAGHQPDRRGRARAPRGADALPRRDLGDRRQQDPPGHPAGLAAAARL